MWAFLPDTPTTHGSKEKHCGINLPETINHNFFSTFMETVKGNGPYPITRF